MRGYVVHFYRKNSKRRHIRYGVHHNLEGQPDKEFRLALIAEYVRTKKRVLKIEEVKE